MSSAPQTNGKSASGQDKSWRVAASKGALETSNPIREIIETMNLAENPNKKVIPLSIGDPTIFGNLKPCQEILDALQRANSCGKYYGYQTAAGMETAREAVAEYHYKCTGNIIQRQDVILASGCSHAIDLSICVLAQNGQNILIPRPGFPLYKTLTSVYGVQYKQYDLLADQDWAIDLEHLESLIDEKTAAIIVNNPSNPCGSVFSQSHLMQILELAEKYRLPIIADEIYDKFVFSPESYLEEGDNHNGVDDNSENRQPFGDNKRSSSNRFSSSIQRDDHSDSDEADDHNQPDDGLQLNKETYSKDENNDSGHSSMHFVPFISLSSLSKRVPILTCGGISKTCLIPGLRLGWIIVNDRQNIFDASVRNGLNRLTQRLMGPNSLVQGALPEILQNVPETFYTQTMDFIFKNAKLCYNRLRLVKGLHPFMPQGSMYLMVRFEEKSFPNIDGDLNFTMPTNVMEEALDRISEFCERHYIAMKNNKNSTKLKYSTPSIMANSSFIRIDQSRDQ